MTSRLARLRPAALGAAAALASLSLVAVPAHAEEATPSFRLVGDLQTELGCTADWDPACADGVLVEQAGTYSLTATLPAPAGGSYSFKVLAGDAWTATAYGAGGSTAPDAANISLTTAGTAELTFVFDPATGRITITSTAPSEALTAADAPSPVRQGTDEQYYFVMTDRFADGDATNDDGGTGSSDRLVSGYDPSDKGFYQGGDLKGLVDNLDYIENLGSTAIWLTPSFKNKYVQGAGTADVSAGYHGYWITDFTQIDPHLGTNADLENLITQAHARGIKVYFDIITNHTADVIDYAEGPANSYLYKSLASAPYKDADGNAFDLDSVANTSAFPTLDAATSFPYTPVIKPEDADVKVPAWLNDPVNYHNRGNTTYTGEDATMGDFGGLDDLFTESPTVVDGMASIYNNWIDTGIDGFRIDTVKHVNMGFWKAWTAKIKQKVATDANPDNDDFFMFGEVYDSNPQVTSPYVRDTQMDATLDFDFQSAATSYAQGGSAKALRALYAGDDYYTTATTNAYDLPTFLGNHDMGRIGYFLKGSTDTLQRDELAHSLMYLTRGQPIVYYGDEQGLEGTGGDKDARQTMFTSQVDQYNGESLVDGRAVSAVQSANDGTLLDESSPLYAHIKGLAALRSDNPALSRGAQIEQYVADGSGIYAFSRLDASQANPQEYLVAVNSAGTAQTASFTALTGATTFTGIYGTTDAVTSAVDGTVTLDVPAYGAVVLKAAAPVSAPSTPVTASFTSEPGAVADQLNPVSVSLSSEDYAEVTFAYRAAGDASWTTLGTTDDGAPRVFHDTSGLADGTLVEYRAVVKDIAGNLTASYTTQAIGSGYGIPSETFDWTGVVSVPGSHGTALGCAASWDPACTESALQPLSIDGEDTGLVSRTFTVPAGSYEYKYAVGGSWDENYGIDAPAQNGANIAYTLTEQKPVTFYFDPATHRWADDATGPVVTLTGDVLGQLGCATATTATCFGSLLADTDRDGTATLTTSALAAGTYHVRAAENLDAGTTYGVGGTTGGADVTFTVGTKPVTFSYGTATHTLSVSVGDTGTGPGTNPGTSALKNVTLPTVAGKAKVGATLTATPGTWSRTGVTVSYQWLRDGKAVSKATSKKYVLTAKDRGARLSVRVTAAVSGTPPVAAASARTAKVAKGAIATKRKPKIGGKARVKAGKKLTVKAGKFAPSGAKVTYRWLRNGKAISKATKKSYKVTAKDRGKKLRVRVTVTKNGYAKKTIRTTVVRVRR